jgi:hypothetical protein
MSERTLEAPEVKIMWPNGPSRAWSPVSRSGARTPYATGGFVGAYVCQGCQATGGVYEAKLPSGKAGWFCSECINPRS